MTSRQAQQILNREAGYEKWSLEEVATLMPVLRLLAEASLRVEMPEKNLRLIKSKSPTCAT